MARGVHDPLGANITHHFRVGHVETKACANGFGVSVRLEGAVKVMLEGAEPLVARFGVGEVAKAMAVASA